MALTWPAIHRIAAAEAMRAHRDLDVDTSHPIDPFSALGRSGVLVMRQPLDRLSGAYLPAGATGGFSGVLINVAHPLSRQRYTAAHELWHHRRDRDLIFDADTEWLARGEDQLSERERLAEAFASWFLMPKRLVESTLESIGSAPSSLDEQRTYALSLGLGTSYSATVRQLYGLKLIPAGLRNRLLKATPQSIKRALGETDVATDPWKDIRLIGAGERMRPIEAVEGDVVVVEMPEIPSSGYIWRATRVPENVSLIRDEYRPASPGVFGGEGTHRFVFSVVSPGRSPIQMELGRPWQNNVAVEVRDVPVASASRPTAGVVDPHLFVGAAA